MYYLTKKVKNMSISEKILHDKFKCYKIDPCISECCDQLEIFEIFEDNHRDMVKQAFDELEGEYFDFYKECPKKLQKENFKCYPDIILDWIVDMTKKGYLGQKDFNDLYEDFICFCTEHNYANKCSIEFFKLFFDKGMKYFYPNSIFKQNKLNFLIDFSPKHKPKVIWDINYTLSVLKRMNLLDKTFIYKDYYDLETEKLKQEFPNLYHKENMIVKTDESAVSKPVENATINVIDKDSKSIKETLDKLCTHIQFLEKRLIELEEEKNDEKLNKELENSMNEEKEVYKEKVKTEKFETYQFTRIQKI